ncbi:hypothetical protein HT031_003587 [Scenedesmus sp. PABB004]|nr:hypothetical protein HT031_003587 [Scenedesmus sp. PABB004]
MAAPPPEPEPEPAGDGGGRRDDAAVPPAIAKSWVPHAHRLGGGAAVFVHVHNGPGEPWLGGELMVSLLVRGSAAACLAALTRGGVTPLGPGRASAARCDGRPVLLVQLAPPPCRWAAALCAPRWAALRLTVLRREGGTVCVMFQSLERRAAARLLQQQRRRQREERRRAPPCRQRRQRQQQQGTAWGAAAPAPRSWAALAGGLGAALWPPELLEVSGGFTFCALPEPGGGELGGEAPAGGEGAGECLVTSILKADLGGWLSERRRLGCWARRLGVADALREQLLSAAVLVKRRVEQQARLLAGRGALLLLLSAPGGVPYLLEGANVTYTLVLTNGVGDAEVGPGLAATTTLPGDQPAFDCSAGGVAVDLSAATLAADNGTITCTFVVAVSAADMDAGAPAAFNVSLATTSPVADAVADTSAVRLCRPSLAVSLGALSPAGAVNASAHPRRAARHRRRTASVDPAPRAAPAPLVAPAPTHGVRLGAGPAGGLGRAAHRGSEPGEQPALSWPGMRRSVDSSPGSGSGGHRVSGRGAVAPAEARQSGSGGESARTRSSLRESPRAAW